MECLQPQYVGGEGAEKSVEIAVKNTLLLLLFFFFLSYDQVELHSAVCLHSKSFLLPSLVVASHNVFLVDSVCASFTKNEMRKKGVVERPGCGRCLNQVFPPLNRL